MVYLFSWGNHDGVGDSDGAADSADEGGAPGGGGRWASEVAGRASYVRDGGSGSEEDWGCWDSKSPRRTSYDTASAREPQEVVRETAPALVPASPRCAPDRPSRHAQTPYLLRDKDLNMYPIHRDFYREHSDLEPVTPTEAAAFLRQKNNIMVQELATYPVDLQQQHQDDDDQDDECSLPVLPARPGIPRPVHTFLQAFWQWPDLLATVERLGFSEPSPIQCIGWPALLGGRDLIGVAQTGTGKTLTFVLPALVHIEGQTKERKHRRGPTALVLSPTRELAMQIESEVLKVRYHGIGSVCCYGGADKGGQISQLRAHPEMVVGTPGRILDLMEAGHLCLRDVSYLVLDEADRMLDMGFEQQVVRIIGATRRQRQSVMTSATWPEAVRMIALLYMNNPVQVNVGSLDLVACKDVVQELWQVENVNKTDSLCDLLAGLQVHDKVIVFVTRKKQCRSLTSLLDRMIRGDRLGAYACVCEIHGDLDQDSREQSLSWFREGRCNILVATNVASRGLDIADVTLVVNYDFPKDIEEYVHRVGRTGRAGRAGKAITFMNDMDWKHAAELRNILQQSKQAVPGWLMHLRAMKASTIGQYSEASTRASAHAAPDAGRAHSMRARYSFEDYDDGDDFDYQDDSCDFFDEFQRRVEGGGHEAAVRYLEEEELAGVGEDAGAAEAVAAEEGDDGESWW